MSRGAHTHTFPSIHPSIHPLPCIGLSTSRAYKEIIFPLVLEYPRKSDAGHSTSLAGHFNTTLPPIGLIPLCSWYLLAQQPVYAFNLCIPVLSIFHFQSFVCATTMLGIYTASMVLYADINDLLSRSLSLSATCANSWSLVLRVSESGQAVGVGVFALLVVRCCVFLRPIIVLYLFLKLPLNPQIDATSLKFKLNSDADPTFKRVIDPR